MTSVFRDTIIDMVVLLIFVVWFISCVIILLLSITYNSTIGIGIFLFYVIYSVNYALSDNNIIDKIIDNRR